MSVASTSSSYLDACASLQTILTTALTGTTTQVWRGVKMDRVPPEFISIGGMVEGNHNYPVMKAGRKKRQETYKLITNIHVVRGGPDPAEAEAKALELYGIIEDSLANDPSMGLSVPPYSYHNPVCNVAELELDSFYDDSRNGWRTLVIAKILIDLRLW